MAADMSRPPNDPGWPWRDEPLPHPRPKVTTTVRIEGIPAWRDTMAASIDLLVAVEQADQNMMTDEVLDKAEALRAVFRNFA